MSEHDGRCRTCGRPLGGDEHEVDGVPGVFHLECVPVRWDAKALNEDIGLLLAQIDWLEQCTGETLEGEDAVLTAQIRSEHQARLISALTTKLVALQLLTDEGQRLEHTKQEG